MRRWPRLPMRRTASSGSPPPSNGHVSITRPSRSPCQSLIVWPSSTLRRMPAPCLSRRTPQAEYRSGRRSGPPGRDPNPGSVGADRRSGVTGAARRGPAHAGLLALVVASAEAVDARRRRRHVAQRLPLRVLAGPAHLDEHAGLGAHRADQPPEHVVAAVVLHRQGQPEALVGGLLLAVGAPQPGL